MTTRRITLWCLAVASGVLLAALAVPAWRDHRAMVAINASDADQRRAAWRQLTRTEPSEATIRAVADLRDAPLLDAEDALLRCGAANRLSADVRLRAADARLDRAAPWDVAAAWSSLRTLAGAPKSQRERAADTLRRLAGLATTAEGEAAALDLAAALAWPDAPSLLEQLPLTAPTVLARLKLMQTFLPDSGLPSAVPPTSVEPLHLPRLAPRDLIVVRRLLEWERPGTSQSTAELLAPPPVGDGDLDVILLALLAERAGRAAELAPLWLRDLDDRTKAAGALLAVLSGPAQLPAVRSVAEAHHPEALRHALSVAEAVLSIQDAAALAHRARRAGDDPTPLLLGLVLASGDRSFLPALTRPIVPDRSDLTLDFAEPLARLLLIERFLPDLAIRLGRPPHHDAASESDTLSAWFARADSLRRLMFPPVPGTMSLFHDF